jgi:hypothetical protein
MLSVAAGFAMLFGVATVIAGGNVLFGPAQMRAAAGAIVPAVLWFNFVAGFAYLGVGAAMALRLRWAATGAASIALANAVVYLAFGMHVLGGGEHELRTVMAMAVRTGFWFVLAVLSARHLKQPKGAS